MTIALSTDTSTDTTITTGARIATASAAPSPAVSPVAPLADAAPAPTPDAALLPVYKRFPVTFVGGRGVELLDDAGGAYLDFASGIAVNALGYGDPGLAAAMASAATSGMLHVSNLYHTQPAQRLAAWLVARSFADRVFFCNSGAEANEGAFKFARRWARTRAGDASIGGAGAAKHEIVALRGSFHGRLFATLAATDRPSYRMPFRPLAPGVSIVERDMEDLAAAVSAETTAAIILEPVQGEGGVRVLDAGLVREVRSLATDVGAALIFDEVQCGLGRTGALFAYEHFGVEPDMLTLAKPLAGGLPMGAVLMREEIAAAVQYGDHGTTFGGGPFVAAVAEHVVGRLGDPAMLAHVRETGAWLGEQLRAIASRTTRVRAVRGMGFMWGVDVVEPAGAVAARALAQGLLLVTSGDHTLRLLPPLVATREELARGCAILEDVIRDGEAGTAGASERR